MNCDVCGGAIINMARSWPRANNVPTEAVFHEGREVKESHLGCFRLARHVQEGGRFRVVRDMEGAHRVAKA